MTTQAEAAALIFARLQTLTQFEHFLGEVPIGEAADAPHVILYPSPAGPVSRRVGGSARALLGFASAVCVNNNATGAVLVAGLVVDLMDGWPMPGGSVVTASVGPAIRDPDMKAGYLWSATVQLSYYLTR